MKNQKYARIQKIVAGIDDEGKAFKAWKRYVKKT